jgi:hypothetical protein
VTTTPFDARLTPTARADGRVALAVRVRVPALSAVADDEVAPVVEDGWAETFERRVVDVGGVTAVDRDLDPTVERDADGLAVDVDLADLDPRRAVDDAVALVSFVEGTYVQGVVPGYDYGEPVSSLLGRARRAGGGAGAGASTGAGADGADGNEERHDDG